MICGLNYFLDTLYSGFYLRHLYLGLNKATNFTVTAIVAKAYWTLLGKFLPFIPIEREYLLRVIE